MKTSEAEWERVLWKAQGFEDNHIHPQYFLESLRKNPNFKPYTYWSLVFLTCAITQHVSSIFIFLGIFLRLREGSLNPRGLLWSAIGAFCVGYGCWTFLSSARTSNNRKAAVEKRKILTLKSSVLVFLALMSLSPVLRTLTAATSSDSIWALSAILFSLNILLADYSVMPANEHGQERLFSVLSVNAAVSSSVVLASRLSTDAAVFALVLCSVVAFACFPLLRRLIQGTLVAWVALTVVLSLFAVALAAYISDTFTYLCASTLVIVTFVAPGVLMWAQKFKNEIRGPWDVAVPIVD
ncbi:phosphatidylinositol N-acetylglucosaminyltransferase [Macrolepiota fuliginosa MF-IS2]|uniref:Phosphatidylinositol N-acetylglucosaminyltransferase n=1 Tax=Macrolepiota fuliginosa MF-IS2 TaxID=1400762 RepID=A0A9P6C699_9AGAR|nr:phosphatidylinositol N-acetylglucosaminyltransferase [Macrolepiota fuliginosa MF-IS2]